MRLVLGLIAALVLAAPARAAVEIQEITSAGGIDAWLVEESSIPFVALELRFRGGTSLDQPGKRGAINLMAALLEEGAGDLSAQEFTARREGLAASFDYDAYSDAISVSAQFLTENRDEAVALLRSSLIAPRFDEDAIERVRAQVLAGLRQDEKDPDTIANRAFMASAFGDHPYGSSGDGTVETVSALTRDDIVAAHRGTMTRDKLFVSAVGDIDAEALGALLDTLLGDLPETGFDAPPPATYALQGGQTVIPFDTPQSVAVFGHEGLDRDDPDFITAYVVNEIMGAGSFESRLMNEVREQRGLTYGIYSYLAARDLAAMVMGRVASSNQTMAEAVDVIRAEWAKIAEQGITAQELEDAKTFLTGSYPLRFDGNGPIANILVGMQMDGLSTDYVNDRNGMVDAITLEEANRVAARLYDPEALHFVIVGQPEGLMDEASN